MKDFGYDVTDYRTVDPSFGSMSDFDELLSTLLDNSMRSQGQFPWNKWQHDSADSIFFQFTSDIRISTTMEA